MDPRGKARARVVIADTPLPLTTVAPAREECGDPDETKHADAMKRTAPKDDHQVHASTGSLDIADDNDAHAQTRHFVVNF